MFFGGGLLQGNCLRVTGGVVHDDKNVFMTPVHLGKETHQIHAHSLEGNVDGGQRQKQGKCMSHQGGVLAKGAALTKVLDFYIHPPPEEVVSDLSQGILAY